MEAMITAITGAVDYATVITGLGTVGAAGALVVIALTGLGMIFGAIRRAK